MKSPTAGFQTAMAKTGTTPVWLLELNGNYYADRTISDGTNSYAAKVLEWADITEKNGRMNGGNMASATSITLHTDVYADVRLNNTANIYLWFENESLSASDRLLMFSGVVTDPISVTETEIVCSIKSIEESKDAVLGSLVDTTTFPNADIDAVGKMLPIIYGDVYEH